MRYTVIGRAVDNDGGGAELKASGLTQEAAEEFVQSVDIEQGLRDTYEKWFDGTPDAIAVVTLPYLDSADGEEEDE